MPLPGERRTSLPYGGYSTRCARGYSARCYPQLYDPPWSINLDPNFCPGRLLNLGPLTWQSNTQSLDHRASPRHAHSFIRISIHTHVCTVDVCACTSVHKSLLPFHTLYICTN